MATVHETYDFDAPVERTYAWFSEHSNLKALFGIDVERIREVEKLGATTVALMNCSGADPHRAIEVYGREVLPDLSRSPTASAS